MHALHLVCMHTIFVLVGTSCGEPMIDFEEMSPPFEWWDNGKRGGYIQNGELIISTVALTFLETL